MAVIFDLDQTIINSRIAFEMRRNRKWKEVYELIPLMSPYTKIVNLINRLVELGIKVAIVTSSPEIYCNKILHRLGIRGVVTVCYHDTEKHKPDPAPLLLAKEKMQIPEKEIIFAIGDEKADIIAAEQINAINILAYWGNIYTYINWDDQIMPFLFCKDEESLINFFSVLITNLELARLRKRNYNIYYLFDYYPISRVHDCFSKMIFDEIKCRNEETDICEAFCRAFETSRVATPHIYGIFVVPSSTARSWNAKLVNYVVPRLVNSMGFIDCSHYILRHTTHDKQAFGGDRSVQSNLKTISLQYVLPPNLKGAVIIDDITTSGNIFEACTELLCQAGLTRDKIYCIAIGGTI